MIKESLLIFLVSLGFFIPIYGEISDIENISFLIKNPNGDRISQNNIKLEIFDEQNNPVATLYGNDSLSTNLSTNHKYQIDIYMTDYLVNTEYVYFDKSDVVDLTVPSSHGVIFSVFYSDGKPIDNAELILFTNQNNKIASQKTDLEGNTLRMWIPPTVNNRDFYQAVVRFGTLQYDVSQITFSPGEQSEYQIITPWPSLIDSLTEIEILDSTNQKIEGKNFEYTLINKNSELKYSLTSIKGNLFISKIPLGDYFVQINDKDSDKTYDSTTFQIFDKKKISVNISEYSLPKSSDNEEIQKNGITCNCVAFRLDDIQNHWLNHVQISVMEVFRETQTPLTIGVISNNIENDDKITNYINSRLITRPELELANHSWDNSPYSDMTLAEQDLLLKKSQNKLKDVFSVTPKVFIPPQNAFNDDTIRALKSNHYTHFSSEFDFSTPPFPLKGESIYHFPAGAETGHLDKDIRLFIGVDNSKTFSDVKKSLSNYGFAVVTMHPQEFSMIRNGTYANEVDQDQIDQLKELLRNIRSEGLRIVTIGKINMGPPIIKNEIPDWLKNTARWWGKNLISDNEFIDGIQFLIKNDVIIISETSESHNVNEIPPWIRNNARWWANDQISNEEFVRGIQFLVDSNIIHLT